MSLVAYGGSSDDESEDENQVDKHVTENGAQGKISDSVNSEENAPQFSDSDDEHDFQRSSTTSDDTNLSGVNTLLKGLPAPKAATTAGGIAADDDLEDEVKPKASQVADAPKPPPKKSRQPVKITIPSVNYDSDEEEPKQKKQKTDTKTGKTGLTSLLPPPIHSTTKETNRTLLPYVFSKKKQTDDNSAKNKVKPSKTSTSVMKPAATSSKSLNLGSYGSDSDDDENDSSSNFFSLDTKVDIPKPVLPSLAGKTTLNLPPPVKSPETKMEVDDEKSVILGKQPTASASNNIPHTELSVSNSLNNESQSVSLNSGLEDAPLSFKSSTGKNIYHKPNPFQSYTSNVYQSDTVGPSLMNQEQMEGYYNPEDEEVLQSDQEFLRLQGKNQRGKEEIKFIDVNADDFISTAEYQKALSEETEYRPSHKKKDGPTSQQKRKHQITYLAHQAKERELELKNAWSQGRMTKKQTQAKYGF